MWQFCFSQVKLQFLPHETPVSPVGNYILLTDGETEEGILLLNYTSQLYATVKEIERFLRGYP